MGNIEEFSRLATQIYIKLESFLKFIKDNKDKPDITKDGPQFYLTQIDPLIINIKEFDGSLYIESHSARKKFREACQYVFYAFSSLKDNKVNDAISQLTIAIDFWKTFMEAEHHSLDEES